MQSDSQCQSVMRIAANKMLDGIHHHEPASSHTRLQCHAPNMIVTQYKHINQWYVNHSGVKLIANSHKSTHWSMDHFRNNLLLEQTGFNCCTTNKQTSVMLASGEGRVNARRIYHTLLSSFNCYSTVTSGIQTASHPTTCH